MLFDIYFWIVKSTVVSPSSIYSSIGYTLKLARLKIISFSSPWVERPPGKKSFQASAMRSFLVERHGTSILPLLPPLFSRTVINRFSFVK